MTLIHSTEMYLFYESVQKQMESSEFWKTITAVLVGSFAFCLAISVYISRKGRNVYLIEFSTFQPKDEYKVSYERFMEQTIKSGNPIPKIINSKSQGFFDEESVEFQRKVLNRTGLGEETYFPPGT